MLAPQSDEEILPIERGAREIDDRIRIKWNARALITRPGYIDASGHVVPPEHDGRWDVVLLRDGEPEYVIYRVRWDGEGNEAYRPVGPWLLEFLRKWDRANAHAAEAMQRMLRDEELQEQGAANEAEEENREFWDRCGFALGKEELIGRGFGLGTATRVASHSPDVAQADAAGDVAHQDTDSDVESFASA